MHVNRHKGVTWLAWFVCNRVVKFGLASLFPFRGEDERPVSGRVKPGYIETLLGSMRLDVIEVFGKVFQPL
jgi:hypothetical protein